MERLRLPFFVIAALALLLVVILEAGSNQCAALLVTVAHGQPRCVVVPRDQLRDKMAEFSTPG